MDDPRPPPSVTPDTPLGTCARRLCEQDAQHLVVVDATGALRGILGDSEVWRRGQPTDQGFLFHDPDERELQARHVTRLAEIEVRPQAALPDALAALIRSLQDVVVVVDEDRRPLGLLTEAGAVTRAAADRSEEGPPVARPTVMVGKECSADESRSLMARKRSRYALVLDDERLFGVLSFRDVAVEQRIAEGVSFRGAGAHPVLPAHRLPRHRRCGAASHRMDHPHPHRERRARRAPLTGAPW